MGVKRYVVTIQIPPNPVFLQLLNSASQHPNSGSPPSLSLHQVQCPIKTSHVVHFTPFYLIELTYGGPVSTS